MLVLVISAMCIMTAHAIQLYTDGDYTYADADANHVALYAYNGDSNVLTVPSYFSDKGVSKIYDYAFENNTAINQIDFSQNMGQLSVIGTKSFSECTSLTGTLTLPSSLRNLGYASFQGCTGLDTLYVNLGIRDIPEQCFNRCSGLRYIYLPTELESINRLAFANCTSLEAVYISSSVTYINEYAFTNSDPTLYVYNNSYAHQFAIDTQISYVVIDPPQPEPTEVPTEEPTEEPTTAPTDAPTEPITPTEESTIAPTEPVTEAPTQAPVAILGDVDGDGSVSTIDATVMQRYLASVAYPAGCNFTYGDVDGDGTITILDVTYIMRYLAGIDVPYPVSEPIQNQ